MKRITMSVMALAIMAGFATNANAQKGWNVSVKATPEFSFLQNSDDNDNKDIDKKATFNTNFGLGAEYNFTDNYGIGADVLYSLQGQKYEVANVDFEQKLEYVKVPVFFAYNSDASKTTSFYGKIGPQVSFLTNARVTDTEGKKDFIENKEAYEKVTFGGMANAGVQFRLAGNMYLQTGVNFDYDFTNAEDKDFKGFTEGRANTNNMTTGVQVGLKYRF